MSRRGAMPPGKYMAAAASSHEMGSYQFMYVPLILFAQTQEVPDKGFLFHVFTQVQNDIHSIF